MIVCDTFRRSQVTDRVRVGNDFGTLFQKAASDRFHRQPIGLFQLAFIHESVVSRLADSASGKWRLG